MKDQSRIIETLAIIDALAEGVNPMTGEILPNSISLGPFGTD